MKHAIATQDSTENITTKHTLFQNELLSKSQKRSTYNNLSKNQRKIIAGYYLPEFIHNNRNQKVGIQNEKDCFLLRIQYQKECFL